MSAGMLLRLGNVHRVAGCVGASGSQRAFSTEQMGNGGVRGRKQCRPGDTAHCLLPLHLGLISRGTLSCTPAADVGNNDNQEAHEVD